MEQTNYNTPYHLLLSILIFRSTHHRFFMKQEACRDYAGYVHSSGGAGGAE